MKKQTQEGTVFLRYANEAAKGIRKASQLLSGMECPENGSLLCGVYYCISDMVQVYLAPVVGKEIHSDELNDITTEILFAEKDETDSIIRKYCGTVDEGGNED